MYKETMSLSHAWGMSCGEKAHVLWINMLLLICELAYTTLTLIKHVTLVLRETAGKKEFEDPALSYSMRNFT